jgi:5'-3' exonuclease
MNQQRSRRYISAQERAKKLEEEQAKVLSGEKSAPSFDFDSNVS